MVRLYARPVYQITVTATFIMKRYKNTFSYLVGHLLQNIPYLYTHTNGTSRGFHHFSCRNASSWCTEPVLCLNLLESTPDRIPLIKLSHKWTRILFIIYYSKLGIWICSQPRIYLNSQSKFYDVITRLQKYLYNTLCKTKCTENNLHLVSPGNGETNM